MAIKSIQVKVFLMLLLLTAFLVLVLSFSMRQGVSREFRQYKKNLDGSLVLHLVEVLQRHYQENNSWQLLQDNNNGWRRLISQGAKEVSFVNSNKRFKGVQIQNDKELSRLSRIARRFVLLDEQKKTVVGAQSNDGTPYLETPLFVNKQTVGFLLTKKPPQQRLEADKAFNNNIQHIFWLLGAALLVLVAAASVPISRYFSKPVLQLIAATKKAAAGDYSARASIDRKDELGQLGKNFNLLTSTLQSNAEVQKKTMADIAHELRTPVAVLQAQIEALQDGIHQADEKNLGLLHQQIMALGRLIEDLHQLSVSDLGSMQYQMQVVNIKPIIEATLSSQQLAASDKNINLVSHTGKVKNEATIMGDGVRLQQMLNNLLANAVAYTDVSGTIELRLREDDEKEQYVLTIADSEPGLLPHEMAQMFDRLYRKEVSRNKQSGGSGLGLAIVKNIVEAHNGSVVASQSKLGGVCMIVRLPKHA